MKKKWEIDRRTFLRCSSGGLGALVGLPLLDVMRPSVAQAGYNGSAGPKRAVFMFSEHQPVPYFNPQAPAAIQRGTEWSIPTNSPLYRLNENKAYLGLIQNTEILRGFSGHHHSVLLSSMPVMDHNFKDNPNPVYEVTADQVIADNLVAEGYRGRRSLHVVAYQNAWWKFSVTRQKAGNPHVLNPRLVYDDLFAGLSTDQSAALAVRRRQQKRSVLDFVRADLNALLGTRVSAEDKRRVNQYADGIRAVERNLAQLEEISAGTCPVRPRPADPTITGQGEFQSVAPEAIELNTRTQMDLVVLALRCDLTRVVTFPFGLGVQQGPFSQLRVDGQLRGFSEEFHAVAHYASQLNLGTAELERRIEAVDHFHMTMLNYFLNQMRAVDEGPATMLDNSIVMYASELRVGPNAHNTNNPALLLAGRGGGALVPDFNVSMGGPSGYQPQQEMGNVTLGIIRAMGGKQIAHGMSPGVLDLRTLAYTPRSQIA